MISDSENVFLQSSIDREGNVQIVETIQYVNNGHFEYTLLFLRVYHEEQAYWIELSIKSRHPDYTAAKMLVREQLNLERVNDLLQQVQEFQIHRRSIENARKLPDDTYLDSTQLEDALQTALWDAVFAQNIGKVCKQFCKLLNDKKIKELLLLISSPEPTLRDIPWELATPSFFPPIEGEARLRLSSNHFGIVRTLVPTLSNFSFGTDLTVASPLKALFVTALPDDSPEEAQLLHLEEEAEKFMKAVGYYDPASNGKRCILPQILPIANLPDIAASLKRFGHEVLHFSGHGKHVPSDQQGYLQLETAYAQKELVKADTVGNQLQACEKLKLVVLNACETAVAGDKGTAEVIQSRAGVPAVIGMRFSIGDEAAIQFSEAFYKTLAMEGTAPSLVQALSTAREKMWRQTEEIRKDYPSQAAEWFTPVLYLNQYLGPLIDQSKPYHEPKGFLAHNDSSDQNFRIKLGEGFIGRRRQLAMMLQVFAADSETTHSRPIALHGPSGIGKTTLAEAFIAYQQPHVQKVVTRRGRQSLVPSLILEEILQHCEEYQSLKNDYALIDAMIKDTQRDKVAVLKMLVGRASRLPKLIFFFDNIDRGEELVSNATDADGDGFRTVEAEDTTLWAFVAQLAKVPGWRVLCTSWEKVEQLPSNTQHIHLDKMRPSEQYRFLHLSCPSLRSRGFEALKPIIDAIDGHTMTLSIFAKALNDCDEAQTEDLIALVQQAKDEGRKFREAVQEWLYARLDSDQQELFDTLSVFLGRGPIAALEGLGLPFEVVNLPKEIEKIHDMSLCVWHPETQEFEVHQLTREWMREMGRPKKLDQHSLARNIFEYYNRLSTAGNLQIGLQYLALAESWDMFGIASLALAQNFFHFGRYERAIKVLEAVIKNEAINNSIQATAVFKFGEILLNLGDNDWALRFMQKSLSMYQEEGNKSGESQSLSGIASVHFKLGELERAFELFSESLLIQQEAGDMKAVATILNNMSLIRNSQGDTDSAIKYLQDSLEIHSDIDDPWASRSVLMNLGVHYVKKEEYGIAQEYLQQSFEMMKNVEDIHGVTGCLHNLGVLFFEQDRFEEALPYFIRSHNLALTIGIPEANHTVPFLSAIKKELGRTRFNEINSGLGTQIF